MPVNPVQSEEEAQAAFSGLYDGDYAFMDLFQRSELKHALAYLHAQVLHEASQSAIPRRARFTAADGSTSFVERPASDDVSSVSLHEVIVIVRNGRVEGFTGAGS